MGFRQADNEGRGGFVRVWSIKNEGKYSTAKISSSRKRRDGDGYETDFQDGFVRLIGSAHEKAKSMEVPEKGVTIQITSCEATVTYNPKTKNTYHNYTIFAFNVPDDGNSGSSGNSKPAKKASAKAKPVVADEESDNEDELPF